MITRYVTLLLGLLLLSPVALSVEPVSAELESDEEAIGEVITLPCGARYVVGNPEDVDSSVENSTRSNGRSSSVEKQ